MAGHVSNSFRVLLARKAEHEKRNISLKEVQRETGIPWTSLQSWANNKVTRFDAQVIMKLCDFLDCDINDLIVYDRENSSRDKF
jgi:DNA-binding Xre family transcriptional regulator